ncbi:MAG: hypothetical protein ACI9H6_000862, partial [Patiriisocius sp.]
RWDRLCVIILYCTASETPRFLNLATYHLVNIDDLLLRRNRMKSYPLFIP